VRYVEFAPPPALADAIASVWELEAGGAPLAEPIFPDGRIELIVHIGSRPSVAGTGVRQPRVMVVGQMTTAIRLEDAERMHAVGIRFTPAGARAWLGVPLHALTGEVHALDGVAPRLATAVAGALGDGNGLTPARGALYAALQAARLKRPGPGLARAVDAAVANAGLMGVDRLARLAGLGARQLERRFLEDVGLSPKRFLRTARFQRALGLLRDGRPPAEVAARCGYADQPHLAREFRAFAGVPAGEVSLAEVAFLSTM
jgi:transcriptional regulator GlxA family with amidase domain